MKNKNCEGPVTLEECEQVIKTFQMNKTPGNDGLPIEFYIEFWSEIKHTLLEAYQYTFDQNTLSTTQKQAIITLINKPGKDKLYIENWRPISLMNVDYKILTKCLAERIKTVLDKLIHNSQFGFITSRNIHDAVRTLLDMVDYTDLQNKMGIMIALDFQKAFDTLSWPYLFKTLEVYGFGPSFISWIKTCYNGIQSCVVNYGTASPYFTIHRGVRQGDPLSPYLFILALEILSIQIRHSTQINGIQMGENEIKVINYADDTTIFLNDLEDAKTLFKILKQFEKLSGLAINRNKSEGFWLGANKKL